MAEISNYAFISKNERKYAFLYLRFSDSFLKHSKNKPFSNAHMIYLFFSVFEISDEKSQICAGAEEEQLGRELEIRRWVIRSQQVPQHRQTGSSLAPARAFPVREA